jgi:DNA (cytosine-5)-methyltransferase 1
MAKPRLLDLFCGAGGAGMGYHLAGFEVVGVDISFQKHYPFEFHQADALEYLKEHGHEFDVIHASPPCQFYSTMTKGMWKDRLDDHPQLIKPVRDLIMRISKPYIIENVEGARKELINPFLLCGTMFGLQTKAGNQLRRHRYFEWSLPFPLVPTCQHNKASAIRVYGGGQDSDRKRPATIGVYGHSDGSSTRDGLSFGIEDRRCAMGIDWMVGDELSEAIPPAYTEFIGKQIINYLG